MKNLCRDGRRVWVAWSNQAILNEHGHLVEILSVGNDITQRKQAEEALQRSDSTISLKTQVGIFRTRSLMDYSRCQSTPCGSVWL